MELKQDNGRIILKTTMEYKEFGEIEIEIKVSEKYGYVRTEMTLPNGTRGVSAELQLKELNKGSSILAAEVLTPRHTDGEIEVKTTLPFK
jgi:hypothetical protein